MGKLSQLLRWKKSVELKNTDGSPILDETGNPLKVWLRIIGDYDLQEAYRLARIASAKKREILRNTESDEYYAEVAPFEEANEEQCLEVIHTARSANWTAEAFSAVVRPDLVDLKEVAIDPDAPTLEEQEKIDKANAENELKYRQAVLDFLTTKEKELEVELTNKTLEELREMAKDSMQSIIPTSVFLEEATNQKVSRAVYMDSDLKVLAFDSPDDFRQTAPVIREQLIEAYNALEANPDDLKN